MTAANRFSAPSRGAAATVDATYPAPTAPPSQAHHGTSSSRDVSITPLVTSSESRNSTSVPSVEKVVGATAGGPFAHLVTAAVGATVWYRITVTNLAEDALDGVTLVDDHHDVSGLDCIIPTLAAGQSFTCSYSATAAAGSTTNTATASSTRTGPVSDSATVVAGPTDLVLLTITKGVRTSPTTGPYLPLVTVTAGSTVYFQIVVTNEGTVALTGLTLVDNLTDLVAAGCVNVPDTLAPGASYPCAYSAVAPEGTRTNTATATSDQAGPVSASAIVSAGRGPIITITKGVRASPTSGAFMPSVAVVIGATVHFRITVTNAGLVDLDGILLTDNLTDVVAAGCTIPATLPVGVSFDCDYDAIAEPGARANTATASATGAGPVSASATVVGLPGILAITKGVGTSPTTGSYLPSVNVVAGTRVSLPDRRHERRRGRPRRHHADRRSDRSRHGRLPCAPSLAPGGSFPCLYDTVASAGTRNNTATAAAAGAGPVSATATVVAATRRPAMTIVKRIALSPAGPFESYRETYDGAPIWYEIIVRNTGNVPLTNVSVIDDRIELVAAGCQVTPPTLGVDGVFRCVYPSTAPHGQTTNTATAFSAETSPPVRSSAVVVARTRQPVLTITKSVGHLHDGPYFGLIYETIGKLVYYRITVTNDGNVPLTGVTLIDSITDLDVADCKVPNHLAIGASFTCVYPFLVPNQDTAVTNSATTDSLETPSRTASAVVIPIGGGGDTLGRIRITKVIASSDRWPGGTFSFSVSCIPGLISLTVPAGRSSASVLTPEILAGTTCTVTELGLLPSPGSGSLGALAWIASWTGSLSFSPESRRAELHRGDTRRWRSGCHGHEWALGPHRRVERPDPDHEGRLVVGPLARRDIPVLSQLHPGRDLRDGPRRPVVRLGPHT